MKTLKQDLWVPVGLFEIAIGLYGIIIRAIQGMVLGGAFIGIIQILVGVALLKRSVFVFWLGFILSLVSLLQLFSVFGKNLEAPAIGTQLPGVLLVLFRFGLYFMLWRQIKVKK